MNRNKFGKISFKQYEKDCIRELISGLELAEEYSNIKLPQRSTFGSAGYDFFSPFDFTLAPGDTILLPTCIRCELERYKFLQIVPRSGLGFKYRLQLDNQIAIIDSDFQNAVSEGHIMLKMSNCSFDKTRILSVKAGEGIAQGIIMSYCLTVDDDLNYKERRVGGIGSTTKKTSTI